MSDLGGIDRINPVSGRLANEWDALIGALSPVADRMESGDWPPPGPIVVVAPHPDDEVLAAGATLAAASDADTEIRILAVTDGEMSHPYLAAAGRRGLVARRLAETVAAYKAVGIVADRLRLSLPDGGAAGPRGAYWEVKLADALTSVVAGAALCLVPLASDGHPDHDACGRIANEVCGKAGVPVASFPIWSWNWDDPDDPVIPFEKAGRFAVSAELLHRKLAGIDAYASQVNPEDGNRPVLPPEFLAHFSRSSEVFLFPA
ncbi:MAG: PIG-L family deacetylase [Acidimicrobiales bacterium]|nr:PIG-L family deacetylase [Acidimicrobiales bacterium]